MIPISLIASRISQLKVVLLSDVGDYRLKTYDRCCKIPEDDRDWERNDISDPLCKIKHQEEVANETAH